MRKIFALLGVLILTAGVSLLAMSPASAHTPGFSADCNGVHVQATAYDAGQQNRWSVTIGGVTQSGTFGSSFSQTFPVPQDGATTSWSASVEAADGSYHGQDSGTVGPCGTPVDDCVDLPGVQPVGAACTPPPDVTRTDSKSLQGCDVAFGGTSYGAGELTYDEQYTDTYAFDDQTHTWELLTDTTATIANLHFTPWSVQQQVANDCTEKPTQPPAEQSSHSSSRIDCDDSVVTTTVTTTTPYVYDEATNSWVPGEPDSTTSTSESPVQPGKCTGVSPTHAETHDAVSTVAPTHAVPTVVEAGLVTVAPAAATPAQASAQASAPSSGDRLPAVLLMLTGVAVAAVAGTRLLRR